jgi:hypothetical protein
MQAEKEAAGGAKTLDIRVRSVHNIPTYFLTPARAGGPAVVSL